MFDSCKQWSTHLLVVSFDWTEVRPFRILMAATAIRRRGVRLLWASYQQRMLYMSQNNLEKRLLRLPESLPPEWSTVMVAADRGFGREELARTCQQPGFPYVIGIKPQVPLERREYFAVARVSV